MGEDKSWREEIIMASSSTGGLCGYSSMNQIQGLMSDEASDQMFNLTTGGTGLDMIGFSTSNNKHTSFFPKEAEDDCWAHNTRLVVDDSSSLRSTTTTHALSLSLNSSIHPSPSTVAALFHHSFQQEFACSTSRSSDQALFGEPHENNNNFQLNNSKYLVPAQELLMELCSLENNNEIVVKKQKREEDKGMGASGKKQGGVGSVELVELEKRKTRLVWMAEEVERRYRHYCNQMKGVVWSLEGVAGKGSARVYSALALKAMSRHFKCLKEGIMGEVEATRRCLGEKDGVGSGATKGETPRLKVIDQALRQQRAFQQMGLIDSHPWRPQRGLPERSVSILRAWLFDHFLNPYPSDADKHILARQTGLSRSQVSNWFINARVRLWKPMVEEMYMEEIKEQEKTSEGEAHIMSGNEINSIIGDEKKLEKAAPTISQGDEKPTVDESETCLIINNPNTTNNNNNYKTHHNMNPPHEHQSLGTSSFGSVELDFSGGMVSFGGSGNVSLTLGLQQDGGIPKGVSLAFPPAAPSYPHTHTSLLMYQNQKDQIHDSPYSLLDNQPQNLPYTHLVGSHSHLLHHLQG